MCIRDRSTTQNETTITVPAGSYIQGNTLYDTGNYSPAGASGMNIVPISTTTTSSQWYSPALVESTQPSSTNSPTVYPFFQSLEKNPNPFISSVAYLGNAMENLLLHPVQTLESVNPFSSHSLEACLLYTSPSPRDS